MPPRDLRPLSFAALFPLAAAAGCYHGENTRISIGHEYTPASFRASPPPATGAETAADEVAALTQEPTLVSIERRNWEVTSVRVPDDRLAHDPIYTRNVIDNPDNARNGGAYPTAISALDLGSERAGSNQIYEAVVAPFAAATDIVLFPARAIATPPWEVVYGGLEPYRRVPTPNPYPHRLHLEGARQVAPLVVPPQPELIERPPEIQQPPVRPRGES